ncbi:DUF6973 domain-containing protein [Persicitalea jodogahamensis]|uniref:DUF6973 domain-containing protein n=1 Tax=Persicitalea jodogahamensis TaxID=402147 RepID=A0A8J3DF40_9BACT|nr:hypothetical protein [Persicitalea jodogahamensis]GHB85551.1 hypothetical protein GCM10007390_46190 [Persicitalea jodogahamensis]
MSCNFSPPPRKSSSLSVSILKRTLVLFLFVFPFSCNRSPDILPQESSSTSLTIDEAKDWYEENQKGARIAGHDKKVIWEDAVEKQADEQQSLVVVPILSPETQLKFSMKTDKNGKKKKAENTYISADVKTSLVFLKKGEKIDVLEMRLIRDEDYYLKKKEKKIDSKDFDGLLYLFNSEEKLISGAQFKNGKVVGTIGAPNKRGRTSYMLLEVCTDWYTVVTTVNGEVLGYDLEPYDTTCENVVIDTGSPDPSNSSFFVTALEGTSGGGGSNNGSLNQLLQLPYISNLWNSLNNYEKDYFTDNYWLLPGAALAKMEAVFSVNLLYCRDDDNGNWNAFKHAFWAAMLCEHVGPFQALIITDLHEFNNGNVPFNDSNYMDFDNDTLGINTYKAIKNAMYFLNYPARLAYITGAIISKIDAGLGTRLISENNGPLTSVPTTDEDRCK